MGSPNFVANWRRSAHRCAGSEFARVRHDRRRSSSSWRGRSVIMIFWAAIFQRRSRSHTGFECDQWGTAVSLGPRSPTRSSRHLLPRSPSGRPSRPFRFRTCSCPAFRKRRKIMRHGGEKWRGIIFWAGEAA